jgi:hypothetical protein
LPIQFGAGPGWHRLSDLIEFFVLNGCVLNELSSHLELPDGARSVRYLYSPKTNDFISLLNYENDEYVPPGEIENWERRLGFNLPRS